MNVVKCPNCGEWIPEDADYCPFCGCEFEDDSSSRDRFDVQMIESCVVVDMKWQ